MEPYEWSNPWEGTEFEEMIEELLEKAEEARKTAEEQLIHIYVAFLAKVSPSIQRSPLSNLLP
jgi:hypothetical protein